MRVAAALACAALVSGCASSPTRITSAYVSPTTFSNLTCDQIDSEIYAVDSKANELHQRISRRSGNDSIFMGVGLLVAWPALLFLSGGNGPDAAEYSKLKGQKDALIVARRGCTARSMTGAQAGEIPGTVHYGKVTVVPADTQSGYCIIAPRNYQGTGAQNTPAITSAMPRCSSLPPVR